MNDLIKVNYDNADCPTVSGRELHEALEVKTAYKDWFPRMCEYGFTEGEDFNPLKNEQVRDEGSRQVTRQITDHAITIPMAKELCMLQRTEKGSFFRKYFIKVEEAWNSPEMVMKRALEIANSRVKELQINVASLTVDNEIMRPKAEYFDELVDRNLLTNIRDTAKELKIKQSEFVKFLLDKKYLYRDKSGKLLPYAKHADAGLFELKEFVNEKTGFHSTQTLVTPKGKETFRLLIVA
ncbi:phage antirepressor KilAC domain-containing protein [Ruminococcus champanellensis]|uniref:phage antirepressor KilAC domain-containing protein n=1 Tax=Ruminococcus champanellensis TaxID=1161942 RepID=UPI003AB26699